MFVFDRIDFMHAPFQIAFSLLFSKFFVIGLKPSPQPSRTTYRREIPQEDLCLDQKL